MKKIFTIYIATTLSVGLFTGCYNQNITAKKNKITSQARHKSTMKPYVVLGQPYEPVFINAGETMNGVASWYGPNFHGKYTSNGEIYDMHEMTAAHKTWPMDTMVKVENKDNGKSVIVRITDRGPFVDNRIIDCSYAAGKAIGLDRSGIANVKITALSFKSKLEGQRPQYAKVVRPTVIQQSSASNNSTQSSNYSIQVGAFKDLLIAQNAQSKYKALDLSRYTNVKSFLTNDGSHIYRVFVNGFSTEAEARDFISIHNLNTNIIIRG